MEVELQSRNPGAFLAGLALRAGIRRARLHK